MKVCQGKCGRNRADRFYRGTRGRICADCRTRTRAVGTKDQRLQETYGITHVEWEAILAAQGGVCAICEGTRKYKGKPQYDVDHDHKEEKRLLALGWEPQAAARASIRGLCCKRCNRRLLPSCLDLVSVLLRAIDYLEHGLRRTQEVLAASHADDV